MEYILIYQKVSTKSGGVHQLDGLISRFLLNFITAFVCASFISGSNLENTDSVEFNI
jgi:hypothetical protein